MTFRTRRGFLRTGTAAILGAAAIDAAPAQARSNAPEESPRKLPLVRVHAGGHYLETEGGEPFFWLGDTAWQLMAGTTPEECSYYLKTRAQQGYSVVQVVALAEMDGIRHASAGGLTPFLGNDPRHPEPAYFARLKEIIREAGSYGLYVALVPAWGDKLTAPWGAGPRLFRNDNLADAEEYARFLSALMREETNVLWMLGGDRPPRIAGSKNQSLIKQAKDAGFSEDQDWTPIWSAMASGLRTGLGRDPLITYHPQGGPDSSSVFLHNEKWLSLNGIQSGHGDGHDAKVWEMVSRDYALQPAKPTIDLEPNYEDHPYNPWPQWDPATGYFRDHDVRKQVYRSVFAGACGVTYGHHAVWQFACSRNGTVNHVDRDWISATARPGGQQMVHLRALMESRPYFTRVPDQSLLVENPSLGQLHARATRDEDGTYAFVYVPTSDQPVAVDLTKLRAKTLRGWWYDPRTGIARLISNGIRGASFSTKTPPYGPDWVLVLEDEACAYPPPGLRALDLATG